MFYIWGRNRGKIRFQRMHVSYCLFNPRIPPNWLTPLEDPTSWASHLASQSWISWSSLRLCFLTSETANRCSGLSFPVVLTFPDQKLGKIEIPTFWAYQDPLLGAGCRGILCCPLVETVKSRSIVPSLGQFKFFLRLRAGGKPPETKIRSGCFILFTACSFQSDCHVPPDKAASLSSLSFPHFLSGKFLKNSPNTWRKCTSGSFFS